MYVCMYVCMCVCLFCLCVCLLYLFFCCFFFTKDIDWLTDWSPHMVLIERYPPPPHTHTPPPTEPPYHCTRLQRGSRRGLPTRHHNLRVFICSRVWRRDGPAVTRRKSPGVFTRALNTSIVMTVQIACMLVLHVFWMFCVVVEDLGCLVHNIKTKTCNRVEL